MTLSCDMPKPIYFLFLFSLIAHLVGCAPLTLQGRKDLASEIATSAGFKPRNIQVDGFALQAFIRDPVPTLPPLNPPTTAHIYIEGDGFAWISRYEPSRDPTPRNPVSLHLAAAHPKSDFVIYLGRPCQYLKEASPRCNPSHWMGARYSLEVLDAMDAALSKLKKQYPFKSLYLYGYSGGAVVAALLAARRDDVVYLTTFAGNLDTAYWTSIKDIEPLHHSINPTDFAEKLRNIPQTHFAGRKDTTVPPEVLKSYQAALGPEAPSRLIFVPDQGHHDGWPQFWRKHLDHKN